MPIALAGAKDAAAGPLIVARERTSWQDALQGPELVTVRAGDATGEDARFAVDGREDTAWTGRAGEMQWRWTSSFARPRHIGLLRAHFGNAPTSGVPVVFRWEVRSADAKTGECNALAAAAEEEGWSALNEARSAGTQSQEALAQPTRRSWFVDADACALRLVVDRTNAGPPVVREVQAIESSEDVLRGGRATAEGTDPGFDPYGAIDGTYGGRWAGAANRSRWTLRVDLANVERIDRIRLVLGFDATSVPRPGGGRRYAVSWAPVKYALELSEDGRIFVAVATEPVRTDGSPLPLRRRLIALAQPKRVRAIRLTMVGATGESGLPEAGGAPVVRELSAYGADDKRPILPAPWVLSVNANPAAQSRGTPGGELTNDAYHAKFLQSRLADLIPALETDDRFARALGLHGEPLDAPARDQAGQVLESIEGDDPELDAQFLAQSSPPPIAVLSGSNDWDYASETGPDSERPGRWHWDPLRDARLGGMGQLGPAVRGRVAPFLGFCGGAQILALLEARRFDGASPRDDLQTIDRVLSRTSGRPIRGFAPPVDVERAWPTDPRPIRAKVRFIPNDPLFSDLAGALRRSTTQALPESHADAVRPDAFRPDGPLARFEVLATSSFCAPDVAPGSPGEGIFPNPGGAGFCDTVPQAFRSRDAAWPVIGAQFHAEQHDFASAAPGDPPESTADPRLFLAGAYDAAVDAYVKLGP